MHLQDPLKADTLVLTGLPGRPGTLGLPAPVTQLIGRGDVIAAGCNLLTSARLVTLTGPGGIGKTQLALAIARRLSDGVTSIELATIVDHDLVVSKIATTLGLRGASVEPIDERLMALLRDRHMLLVLDNAEHLLGAAPEIAELLAACPQLSILVTSRSPLRLRGEHELDVLPLVTPPREHTPPPEELIRYPAVELFVRQAEQDFIVDPEWYRAAFAADLPKQQTRVFAATQRPFVGAALATPSGPAAWKTLPSWYAVATADQAIHPDQQRFYAKRMGATTIEVDASHSIAVSRPNKITDLIRTALADLA